MDELWCDAPAKTKQSAGAPSIFISGGCIPRCEVFDGSDIMDYEVMTATQDKGLGTELQPVKEGLPSTGSCGVLDNADMMDCEVMTATKDKDSGIEIPAVKEGLPSTGSASMSTTAHDTTCYQIYDPFKPTRLPARPPRLHYTTWWRKVTKKIYQKHFPFGVVIKSLSSPPASSWE